MGAPLEKEIGLEAVAFNIVVIRMETKFED